MEMLKCFFTFYFNESCIYEDLDESIQEFKNIKKQGEQKQFIFELDNIIKKNDYEKVLQLMEKCGMQMSRKKAEIFIKFLCDRMHNIPTPIEPKDFCDIKTLLEKTERR